MRATAPLALITIGLLMALYATAHAGGQVLPTGTTVTVKLPTGTAITEVLGEDHLLITADTARSCVVAKRVRDVLRTALTDCVQAAEIAKPEGESRWWSAVKYTAIGVAIGGAFALGVVAAR